MFSESDWNIQFQCDDIDDNDDFHRCEDGLAEELSKCFDSCGGVSSCIIACSTDYENGLKECPCMEGCPGGCPCENWDCTVQVLYFRLDFSGSFVFSVVHKTSTISTHVKMPFQSSLENALKVVVHSRHVSSNVLTTMKLP